MPIRWSLSQFRVWFTVFSLTVTGWASAAPFDSAPGSRAQAMGGAASAIQDSASVWYNPAALATARDSVRLQWYQGARLDTETDELSGRSLAFAGFQQRFGPWSSGLYYLTPYSQDYRAISDRSDGRVSGRVRANYNTFSVPLALSLNDGLIRVGATLDWSDLSFSGSDLRATLDADNPMNPGTPIDVDPRQSGGVALSTGILVRVLDYQPADTRVHLGVVYRSRATDNPENSPGDEDSADDPVARAEQNRLADRVLLGRPSSAALGLSVVQQRPGEHQLTLAAQADHTRWSSRLSTRRFSLGGEYSVPWSGRYDVEMDLRLGSYLSRASNGNTGMDWPDSTGLTAGLGLSSRDAYRFDVNVERQSIRHPDRTNSSAFLFGLEINRFF